MAGGDSGTVLCPRCGAAAGGSFCSSCGASLTGGRKSTLDDLPLIGDSISLARTFWRTTRAPIAEPVRLAAIAGDKSPYKFLITGIGMFIGFFLAMEALAKAWGQSGFTREQEQFLSFAKYAILIHLIVAAAVVYVATALIAGRRISVGSHARLWALLGGYYLTAIALFLITVVTIYGLIYFELPAIAPAALKILTVVLTPAVAGLLLLMLINLVVAHARQWVRPLWISATIFAMALITTHLIAPPLDSALVSGIGGVVRKLGVQSLFDVP
jgi:hypothetical protein